MYRRKFLQWIALSTTGGLASMHASGAASASTLVYMVRGFSCPTCAAGLDAILAKRRGVVSSHSTYPEGKVVVRFHPEVITEKEIQGSIEEMGFSVASRQKQEHTEGVDGK